jgi:hypothetical protein
MNHIAVLYIFNLIHWAIFFVLLFLIGRLRKDLNIIADSFVSFVDVFGTELKGHGELFSELRSKVAECEKEISQLKQESIFNTSTRVYGTGYQGVLTAAKNEVTDKVRRATQITIDESGSHLPKTGSY